VPKTERPRHLKRAVTDCQAIIPHLANKPCANPDRVRGELKWRYFAPNNNDKKNPMKSMPQPERDNIRTDLYKLIGSETSVRTIACVCSTVAAYGMHSINSQDDLYHIAYKPLTERFQYYLQDLGKTVGRKEYGIIVGDHRGQQDDRRLRGHHQKLLHASAEFISHYSNLIESLFLEPSHLSVGIQLADMVAGAIWRKFERNDDRWYKLLEPSLRKSPTGIVDGYGIIKMPKNKFL
jgi:hypothetical protein